MTHFSPEQQIAFDKYVSGENIFITGPGGSGKSYLIRKIASHARQNNKKIAICAMTGCAAILLNCKAKTLHSWAGIGLARGDDNPIVTRILTNNYKRNFWKYTDVLVLDEVSMLSVRLFNLLDLIGRRVRKSPLPFGGIQLVFCGDFFQLPPIGNDEEPESKQFCFESKLWNETFENSKGEQNQIELTTIFRQKDAEFAKILNQIRVGRLTKTPYNTLLKYVGRKVDKDSPIKPTILFPTRSAVEQINRTEMAKLDTEIKEFRCARVELLDEDEKKQVVVEEKKEEKEDSDDRDKLVYSRLFGTPEERKEAEESIKKLDEVSKKKKKEKKGPTEKQKENEEKYIVSNALFDKCLKLRKGAQVMCIANVDMDNGIYNGSQGIIRGFNEEGKPIVHFANGVERAIGPHTWLSENISGMGVSQIPLVPSWAITIHKSQGSTLDMAEIDIGNGIFECGQSYVALSRVRNLDGLYLSAFNPQKIKVNKKVKEYYDTLKMIRKTNAKKDVLIAPNPVSPVE